MMGCVSDVDFRKMVPAMAIVMPTAAMRLPRRAVLGLLIIFNPRMKVMDAIR